MNRDHDNENTRARSGVRRRVELPDHGGSFPHAVGTRIRALRYARGVTQAELAMAARLTANYIARVERGEMGPSLEVAYAISRALEVPLDALVSFAPGSAESGNDSGLPTGTEARTATNSR